MLFAGCHLPQPLDPVARVTVWAHCPLCGQFAFSSLMATLSPRQLMHQGCASCPGGGSAESLRQEQARPGGTRVTQGADRSFFGLIRRRDGEGGTEKADVESGSAPFPPPTCRARKHEGSSAPWERNPPKPRQHPLLSGLQLRNWDQFEKRQGGDGRSADGSRSAVRGAAATQGSENGVRTRGFQAWLFYSLPCQRRRGWNTPLMVTRRQVSQ